jgi:adenosylcobinamide-GDP ribazoletransferase
MPSRPQTETSAASSAWEPVRLVVVAVRFLTRLPLPEPRFREGDLRRATGAFPLVGVVVAAFGIAAYLPVQALWGVAVAVVVATAVEVGVTGAFHEDGLADVADGLWGGWTVEDRLRIMRDSRLGTYGTVALVGVLALRVVLLGGLDPAWFWRATLVGHVTARGSILLMVRLLPPADDGGSGAQVSDPTGPLGSTVGAVTLLAVAAAALGAWAWVPVVAAVPPIVLTTVLYERRLGGVTGDALGATNQLVHVAVLAGVALLPGATP